jgi:Membrane bound beta barrel domain (DUF5777)
MNKKIFFAALVLLLTGVKAMAQDLDALLESQTDARTNYTAGTFKATRLINGQSIERMQTGQLDFRIDHRFGLINDSYNAFGLDQSNVHLTADYGITDWVMVGIGRAAFEKTVDAFLKFSVLRQSNGKVNMPVSVSLLLASDMKGAHPVTAQDSLFANNLSYTSQILIARKFTENLSLQLMPTFVHRNLVVDPLDQNNVIAAGIGGRYKLSSRVSFNAEYYYSLTSHSATTYNPLALGFDVETGGHVFQLFVTNAISNTERGFITGTTNNFMKGDIRLGFKISRVFPLIHRKEKKDIE